METLLMSSCLTKSMYGTELTPIKSMFGFKTGQLKVQERFPKAGWYNLHGERLGWGDLTDADLEMVSRKIPEKEVFIILSEWNSHWNTVAGRPAQENDAPGKEYIFEHLLCFIVAGAIYTVSPYQHLEPVLEEVRGWLNVSLPVYHIDRESAVALIEKLISAGEN